jgi:hypothetical protein
MNEIVFFYLKFRMRTSILSCIWKVAMLVFVLIFSSLSVQAENETRYLEMLAKAKQQLENSPDSAILIATEVFQHTTVDSLRARSAYLLGIAYYYNGLYHVSKGCYEDALQCAYTSLTSRLRRELRTPSGLPNPTASFRPVGV